MLAQTMVNEEIQSESTTIPRRGSPLPWLLLGVTICVAIGIFSMATRRLGDERLRTAAALKANDEVMGRLRTAASEFAKSELTVTELETKKAILERQVGDLEEKSRTLATELQELRDKTGSKRGRKKGAEPP